jgi:hypothetical protein
MSGTTREATSPMRRMPPMMTTPTATVRMTPVAYCGTPK